MRESTAETPSVLRQNMAREILRICEMSNLKSFKLIPWTQIQLPKIQAGVFPSGSPSQVRSSVFSSASSRRRLFAGDPKKP
jgi:hypothetical protein